MGNVERTPFVFPLAKECALDLFVVDQFGTRLLRFGANFAR
jgi:hypothetical protein